MDFFIADVMATNETIKMIKDDKGLQLEALYLSLNGVVGEATVLKKTLTTMEEKAAKDGNFKKFVGHFIRGNKDNAKMERMRANINTAKSTLTLALLAAPIGRLRLEDNDDDDREAIFDPTEVDRISGLYKKHPNLKDGPRMKQLLEARGRMEPDGYHLKDEDLEELKKPPPYLPPLKPGQTRQAAIRSKASYGGEVLTLGPVGTGDGNEYSVHIADEYITTDCEATMGGVVGTYSLSRKDWQFKEELRAKTALQFAAMKHKEGQPSKNEPLLDSADQDKKGSDVAGQA
jgi:hypothetical protein